MSSSGSSGSTGSAPAGARGGDGEPSPGEPPRPRPRRDWQGPTALIGTIAALITALYTIFGGTSPGVEEGREEQSSPEVTASSESLESSTAGRSKSTPKVRWSDEFVAVLQKTDLDTVPASRTYYDAGDLHASWGQPKSSTVTAYFTYDTQGVELDPGVKASPDTCARRAATHAVDTLDVEVGTRFCLITNGGRTAAVEVTSVDIADDEFTAQAVVWEK
jgi:hypothetical protein